MNNPLDIDLSGDFQFTDQSGCIGTQFHDQNIYDGL